MTATLRCDIMMKFDASKSASCVLVENTTAPCVLEDHKLIRVEKVIYKERHIVDGIDSDSVLSYDDLFWPRRRKGRPD